MASKAGTRMDTCGCGNEKQARSRRCESCAVAVRRGASDAVSTVAADRDKQRTALEISGLRKKYDEALRTIETLERTAERTKLLSEGVETFEIEPKMGSGTAEGTVVVVASDWHVEERVGPEVGGLNRYTPEIATARATQFFQAALRLTRLLQQDIRIDHMVLALLGDFITNDIHEAENAEMNALLPTHAIVHAQNLLISGIQFLLDNSTLDFVIPCHSGNHARTTKTTRFGAENGHSLEYLMYCHLAAYFRQEKRIQFVIPEGMHSYLRVYDKTLRFYHGHGIKYGGGVGGIYIPTNKKIAQYNKAVRADLDIFGHFHQLRDGGNFICNGSMIGMNSFALAIGADYEPPKQTLFLIDKARGRTCLWPIVFDDAKPKVKKAA